MFARSLRSGHALVRRLILVSFLLFPCLFWQKKGRRFPSPRLCSIPAAWGIFNMTAR